MLSDAQIDRYSRQIVLSEIGGRGQERLLCAEVAIHGGGDAALVCATYLAGAGVDHRRPWPDFARRAGIAVSLAVYVNPDAERGLHGKGPL